MTTTTEPQEVIVSHSHVVDDPTPWRWASKKIVNPSDIRLGGRGQFPDCETAVKDAEGRGHTVVGIQE